jgi:hypothetical protein
MPVQIIELEEVKMIETTDTALEAIFVAQKGFTWSGQTCSGFNGSNNC